MKAGLNRVSAEKAKASVPEDEAKVNKLIKDHLGGFQRVDETVRDQLLEWYTQQLVVYLKA